MKKVVVGLSGGVDSSVAALLLKNQGYKVIGITFKFTNNFDVNDAIKIANKLKIEHHIIDYTKIFEKEIITTFISDYNKGITPNPCILCNKRVKIKFLADQMDKYGADYMATGHYAKIKNDKLYLSNDEKKDQTYFLSQVSKDLLAKLLLPLENIDKENVRKIALENNLENANKKDSTDVCFITKTFKEYIYDKIESNLGDIINIETNEKVGTHKGLSYYTIGQRKGLNLGGNTNRAFVVGKNANKNILYICFGDENDYLISDSAIIKDVNWITNQEIKKCYAKFRYHQKDSEVEIEKLDNNEVLVKYKNVKSVTPGQACAFYLNNECLGGGIIKEVRKNNKKIWYL